LYKTSSDIETGLEQTLRVKNTVHSKYTTYALCLCVMISNPVLLYTSKWLLFCSCLSSRMQCSGAL